MRHAVINTETNIVENVILWDGQTEWQCPEGCYTLPLGDQVAGPGWSYVDGQFIPPAVE